MFLLSFCSFFNVKTQLFLIDLTHNYSYKSTHKHSSFTH